MSANPTGPLTIGNARGAFIGDLLSRVLEAGGQAVTREYYFNDSGGQIDNLGASVARRPARRAGPGGRLPRRLRGATSPPRVPDDLWADATADDADAAVTSAAGRRGRVREGIEATLEHLGVHFDVWTTEASLHEGGWVDRAVERLREQRPRLRAGWRAVVPRRPTFGDDKDRVIYPLRTARRRTSRRTSAT